MDAAQRNTGSVARHSRIPLHPGSVLELPKSMYNQLIIIINFLNLMAVDRRPGGPTLAERV